LPWAYFTLFTYTTIIKTMIIIAHNGVDDGHPNETYSPSIGMPPAPPAPTQTVQAISVTPEKNNDALLFIPIVVIAVMLAIAAIYFFRIRKPNNS
jgi:hypothetical protein